MSLADPVPIFAGHDQPDVASLTTGGVDYRCYIWLNRAKYQIEASCYAVQHDGTEVFLFCNVVEAATSTEASDTAGYPLDCPKILASGTRFVVHWLQATDINADPPVRNWTLNRATMNMAAFDPSTNGWTNQGSTAIYQSYALYDHAPVLGNADDFVVAWATAADEISVARFTATNYLWATTLWDINVARAIEGRVLGVYAHDSDNDVIITYEADNEGGSTDLYSMHIDADDGGTVAEVEMFPDFGAASYVQVTHRRVAQNRVALAAECASAATLGQVATDGVSHAHLHHVLFREINSDSAARVGNEHYGPNLGLCSRLFSNEDGSTLAGGGPCLYAICYFRSCYTTNEWEQSALFAVNFNYQEWQAVDSGAVLRPRPIANFVHTGVPDARTSGWHPEVEDPWSPGSFGAGPVKRMNHLSNVVNATSSAGTRDVKAKVAAVGVWARMSLISEYADPATTTELLPENLGVAGFVVHLEDPWTVYRDADDPTQPVDNFKGAYSRAMCQTCSAGRATFVSGGTPCLYDGRQVVEVNFPWRPEFVRVAGQVADGDPFEDDLTLDGVYQWYAVYSWRDNAGQIHRSGPSRVVELNLGATQNNALLRIRQLNLSLKDATHFYPMSDGVTIDLYRTPESAHANYPTFYRVHGSGRLVNTTAINGGGNTRPRDSFQNDPEELYQTFYDGLDDDRLIFQEPGPYQYGEDPATGLVGPLPQTSPALTVCANWLNRVFAADALDPAILWYTDEIFPDYGSDFAQAPFFNDSLTFRLGEVGELTALVPMDNYLVAFTASTIGTIASSGAGAVEGSLLLDYTVRHVGTGCIEPRSVVLGPPGIFFQTAKGYYLLNRGFELDYLSAGASVEDEIREAGNIRSADLLEDRHQIRLTCNARPVTTYTTSWVVNFLGANGVGDWTISATGFGQIAAFSAGLSHTESDIATGLAADIDALVADGSIDHLIQNAVAVGDTLTVTWTEDVVPAYTDTNPVDTTFVATDSSSVVFYPRVLIYDYLHRLWSRADLQPSEANTSRLSESVDATTWANTNGETSHVVLQQGHVLIERASTDDDAYTDQNAIANAGIPIDVQTSWLHLAGMAGWKRIRSIGLQTERLDATSLFVDLEFDRTGTHDPFEVETEEGIEWSQPAPAYGRIRPRIQRMTSIRIRIYEESGVANTENVALFGITLEVGVEKGLRRVADSQIGST